jgi:toxin ParE1/3/4
MGGFRLSTQTENELDSIWLYSPRESGSVDVATRVVENISERFWLLAQYPYIGRARDQDLGPGLRSLIADDHVIIHRVEENDIVLILHVVAGNRDIVALFGAEG